MTSTTTIILMLYFIRGSLGHDLPLSPIVGIAGGHSVSIEDAPFMAALMHIDSLTNTSEVWCGGTIIHKQYVLTSAFCSELSLLVRVGSSIYNEEGHLHQVEKYIIHESYSLLTNKNNVGLLKLSEHVTFGPSVAAIWLADEYDKIPIGLTANVTGWGQTESGTSELSLDLRQVSVSVSPPEDCSKFFDSMKLTDKQICVNNEDKGACYRDAGGPLISGDLQIGIASYGATCWDQPNVYEKVAPHLQWIRNKVIQNI